MRERERERERFCLKVSLLRFIQTYGISESSRGCGLFRERCFQAEYDRSEEDIKGNVAVANNELLEMRLLFHHFSGNFLFF
jgi:hypothetical protein